LDSLPCSICRIDIEQRFRFGNKAFISSFETFANRAPGRYLWEIIGESDYDALRPGIIRALQGEEVIRELSLRRQKDRYFYCKFVPERFVDGSVIGVFVIQLDISDRKVAEDHLMESEARSRRIAQERADLLESQEKRLEESRIASRSKDLVLA